MEDLKGFVLEAITKHGNTYYIHLCKDGKHYVVSTTDLCEIPF